MISGSGWVWARARGGGDSLGYRRGRGQSIGLVRDFIVFVGYMDLRWL